MTAQKGCLQTTFLVAFLLFQHYAKNLRADHLVGGTVFSQGILFLAAALCAVGLLLGTGTHVTTTP